MGPRNCATSLFICLGLVHETQSSLVLENFMDNFPPSLDSVLTPGSVSGLGFDKTTDGVGLRRKAKVKLARAHSRELYAAAGGDAEGTISSCNSDGNVRLCAEWGDKVKLKLHVPCKGIDRYVGLGPGARVMKGVKVVANANVAMERYIPRTGARVNLWTDPSDAEGALGAEAIGWTSKNGECILSFKIAKDNEHLKDGSLWTWAYGASKELVYHHKKGKISIRAVTREMIPSDT